MPSANGISGNSYETQYEKNQIPSRNSNTRDKKKKKRENKERENKDFIKDLEYRLQSEIEKNQSLNEEFEQLRIDKKNSDEEAARTIIMLKEESEKDRKRVIEMNRMTKNNLKNFTIEEIREILEEKN